MGYLFWVNDIIYSSFELLLMSKFECEVIIHINSCRWKALNFRETHINVSCNYILAASTLTRIRSHKWVENIVENRLSYTFNVQNPHIIMIIIVDYLILLQFDETKSVVFFTAFYVNKYHPIPPFPVLRERGRG